MNDYPSDFDDIASDDSHIDLNTTQNQTTNPSVPGNSNNNNDNNNNDDGYNDNDDVHTDSFATMHESGQPEDNYDGGNYLRPNQLINSDTQRLEMEPESDKEDSERGTHGLSGRRDNTDEDSEHAPGQGMGAEDEGDDEEDDEEEEEEQGDDDDDDDDTCDGDEETYQDELLGLFEEDWQHDYVLTKAAQQYHSSPPGMDEQAAQKLEQEMCRLHKNVEDLQQELKSEQSRHATTKESLSQLQSLHNQPIPEPKRSTITENLFRALEQLADAFSLAEYQTVTENNVLAMMDVVTAKAHELQTKPVGCELIPLPASRYELQSQEYNNLQSNSIINDIPGRELIERIQNLEAELQSALLVGSDIQILKAKAVHLLERVRKAKEGKRRCESEIETLRHKIDMLSSHIEKLMVHLKHEATAKVKTYYSLRQTQQQLDETKNNNSLLVRKCTAKDRLLQELQEGSKILEDQLRLMDEKYLELRTKLDWQRDNSKKEVARYKKVAQNLRTKFALLGGSMLLDQVDLPAVHSESSTPGSHTKLNQARTQSHFDSISPIRARTAPKDVMKIVERVKRKTGKVDVWTEAKARGLVYPAKKSNPPSVK